MTRGERGRRAGDGSGGERKIRPQRIADVLAAHAVITTASEHSVFAAKSGTGEGSLFDPANPARYRKPQRDERNQHQEKAQGAARRAHRLSKAEIGESEITRQHADDKKENADKGGGDTRRYPALRGLVGKDGLCHAADDNRTLKTAIE